jgi:hypothetical protein
MTCQCISPECAAPRHVVLECGSNATHRLRSRDWGDEIIWMCAGCALYARGSGMFVDDEGRGDHG